MMGVMSTANDLDPEHLPTMRRIRRTALVSAIVLGAGVGVASGWRAVFALTCAAAVVMINFLWLEETIKKTLRPAPEVKSWRVFVRVILRFLLLGAALTGTLVFAREESLSVILGFSIIVIGIMGEAAWAMVRSFRQQGH
jgi:chromate transport protein ChrA